MDPFNLTTPRKCPYCGKAVSLDVRVTSNPSAVLTTLIDWNRTPSVCERWTVALRTAGHALGLHVLTGSPAP